MAPRPILTAVAWPYANGPRHIGHVAGFGVPSDVFSRYQRMAGNQVLMVSGTDEHGTPILVQADQEGVGPRELADRYNRVIAEDLRGLGLAYDLFTRTTTRNHEAVVHDEITFAAFPQMRHPTASQHHRVARLQRGDEAIQPEPVGFGQNRAAIGDPVAGPPIVKVDDVGRSIEDAGGDRIAHSATKASRSA